MDRQRLIAMLKGEEAVPPYFLALAPLGHAYAAVMRARALLYEAGVMSAHRLPCKVISVGNITMGGTGKTPMAALVARRLAGMGLGCCVVTRGYKGGHGGAAAVASDGAGHVLPASETGDEPALLASLLPGTPVVVGADRYNAGLFAIERFGPDVLVLDDGFQHLRLHRDLNILLLDAARPFGNGRTLPAGYMREPLSAVGRADLVVMTRADRVDRAKLDDTRRVIGGIRPGLPVVEAAHVPARLTRLSDGSRLGLETLSGEGVYAFCGVADPASFSLMLNGLSANIIRFDTFDDHHLYTRGELDGIALSAAGLGAAFVVTTEKDAVKLAGMKSSGVEVLALGVEMELAGGDQALDALIREKILVAGR